MAQHFQTLDQDGLMDSFAVARTESARDRNLYVFRGSEWAVAIAHESTIISAQFSICPCLLPTQRPGQMGLSKAFA